MYQKNVENGYIVSIVSGVTEGNITEEEYNQILNVTKTRPQAPDGYQYRLKEDLTFELCKLPEPTIEDEEATEQDFINALYDLGVSV